MAGLDLGARYEDVRRLVWCHPAFRSAIRDGHDADDLLQEILLRLLVRQRGRSAYAPERASVSKYVYVVVANLVTNYRRDHQQRLSTDDQGRSLIECDHDGAVSRPEHDGQGVSVAIDRAAADLDLDATDRAILQQLADGHHAKDIRARLGISTGRPDLDKPDRVQVLVARLGEYLGAPGYGARRAR